MVTQFFAESDLAEQTQIGTERHTRISNILDDVSFLRLPEVKAITGLSKTSLYELIRTNSFPAPVRLAPRAVAWVRSEVKQWAEDRILASRSPSVCTPAKKAAQSVPSKAWASARKLA